MTRNDVAKLARYHGLVTYDDGRRIDVKYGNVIVGTVFFHYGDDTGAVDNLIWVEKEITIPYNRQVAARLSVGVAIRAKAFDKMVTDNNWCE